MHNPVVEITLRESGMTAEQMILEALRKHQQEMGLSPSRFAQEVLGISKAQWCRLSKQPNDPGARKLGVDVALAAQSKFPDLEMFVNWFIMREYPQRRADRRAA